MSREAFPPVERDLGPPGMVDLLLGLYSATAGGRALIEELAATAGDANGAPPTQLVDVLLGVVALARAVERAMPPPLHDQPPPAVRRPREDLLR